MIYNSYLISHSFWSLLWFLWPQDLSSCELKNRIPPLLELQDLPSSPPSSSRSALLTSCDPKNRITPLLKPQYLPFHPHSSSRSVILQSFNLKIWYSPLIWLLNNKNMYKKDLNLSIVFIIHNLSCLTAILSIIELWWC